MKGKGTFTLSLDVELKWGMFDLGKDLTPYHFERTREVFMKLLTLLEKYEIPATFAVVGHLFLNSCDGKHSEIVRPHYKWWKKDWFDQDPGSNREHAPDWYGDDLIQAIQKSKIKHEIASHSFSHVIFGDPGCSKETVDSELRACTEVAKGKLTSFVFPRNSIGHLDVLKKHGFTTYRGLDSTWFNKFKGPLRTLGHLIDTLFGFAPPVSSPKTENGLTNLPGSMVYLSRFGLRRFIPMSCRTKKAKKGIDRAIKEEKNFHLWFHPFNLCMESDQLLGGLEEIFIYLKRKEANEQIEIKTMFSLSSLHERS